ncbi:MAG: response regulator transcription factor [Pseudomonadota bacterium]
MQIALLEDDVDQATLLNAWLSRLDAEVTTFGNGQDLKNTLKKAHFDLFLLDWELPDTTGLEVLDWIRNHLDWQVPVIFLTLRDSEEDIVRALDSGADDYIVKPLTAELTLARIRNVLRRVQGPESQSLIKADPYEIDLEQRCVKLRGEMVAVTQREFTLACYLFQHPAQVLSRETLLREVWGIEANLNTRTVDTHISRVRSKLNICADNGWLLHSIYQYGYRLEPLTQH